MVFKFRLFMVLIEDILDDLLLLLFEGIMLEVSLLLTSTEEIRKASESVEVLTGVFFYKHFSCSSELKNCYFPIFLKRDSSTSKGYIETLPLLLWVLRRS